MYSSLDYFFGQAHRVIGLFIAAIIFSIIAILALYIFVLPVKKRKKLPKFLRGLHDFFRMKKLFLESVIRFLYIAFTVFSLVFGIFMLFSVPLVGLTMIFIYPIFIRLIFEGLMLGILLVKNVMEINNRLGGTTSNIGFSNIDLSEHISKGASRVASAIEEAKEKIDDDEDEDEIVVEENTKGASNKDVIVEVDENTCPNCGSPNQTGNFCTNCGFKRG